MRCLNAPCFLVLPELNLGGENHIFAADVASGPDNSRYWVVFRIEVDQSFTPRVISVQELRDAAPTLP